MSFTTSSKGLSSPGLGPSGFLASSGLAAACGAASVFVCGAGGCCANPVPAKVRPTLTTRATATHHILVFLLMERPLFGLEMKSRNPLATPVAARKPAGLRPGRDQYSDPRHPARFLVHPESSRR